MDRSFLSDTNVVAASREFVCIRLATYEDKSEAAWLRKIYVGRSGELENTVFAMLAPDGKKLLCRPGRSPHFTFRTPELLATAMEQAARTYPAKPLAEQTARVPQMKNFRLSLNVASCDGVPLVVAYGNEKQLGECEPILASLACDKNLAGRFHYFLSADKSDLEPLKGFDGTAGIYLVNPGKFGVDGAIVDSFHNRADFGRTKSVLIGYSAVFSKVEKSHHDHVRQGINAGIDWKTEVEVTDPDSVRAKRRIRGG